MNNKYDAAEKTLLNLGYAYVAGDMEWKKYTSTERAVKELDRQITLANQTLTGNYKSPNEFTSEAVHLLKVIKAGNIHGITWSIDND